MKNPLPLIGLLFLSFTAQAQETITFKEYGFQDAEPDVQIVALANGDSLHMSRYYFHSVSDSPDWPAALLYCQGNDVWRAGRRLFASGTCTRRDADGDLQQTAWEWPPDATGGPIRVVAGTGKYAELLDCEGEWRNLDVFADVQNRWVNESTMTCTRK